MQCIIFTDTKRLAEKYSTSRQDAFGMIERNLLAQTCVNFMLLDAADYADELESDNSWHGYKSILIDFMMGMGLRKSPALSVFIIGGDDVIPMPRIENPYGTNDLHADLIYCFEEDELDSVDIDDAICNVGRMPMENGPMPTSLDDDLQSYFNLAGMFLEEGLEVSNVVMTSTRSWLPASTEMVRGLPVISPAPISGTTKDDMYTSPGLEVDNDKILQQYSQDIGNADMLIFNLHGSDSVSQTAFLGEDENSAVYPDAFHPQMLKDSSARIFNTVACYGARFVDYERKNSMLLSSIYGGGIMLYAGSCEVALGRSGARHNVADDLLVPAGMSESFMRLYSLYLFRGMGAGEAFLKAKCDYFNTCRGVDGDEKAMFTILEFNLYGMPVLRVKEHEKVIAEARGMKRATALPVTKHTKREYRTVYEKGATSSHGLLDEVRSLVDRNLQMIRQTVEDKLYNYWGLNPRDLTSIEQVTQGGLQKGYRFCYTRKNAVIVSRHWAYTDTLGKIKDVIHTK